MRQRQILVAGRRRQHDITLVHRASDAALGCPPSQAANAALSPPHRQGFPQDIKTPPKDSPPPLVAISRTL
ncbi:Transcription factor GTE2 [Clarias magur]|uniref:Transcription factor GTE2 n=1 Tax=Clarias magur TaxID=1594786 RepID=A0A8J4T9J5_CLAMG|nr:Transcription factor GTE2 [Clarias magur]